MKNSEVQRTIHVAVSPQVPQRDADCCSTPLHASRQWRPPHGQRSTGRTPRVSVTRASAERTTNTSSGVNNASSGVNNASPGVNNASSGVNNASSGVNNTSSGVNSASSGVNNTSSGVNSASSGVNNTSSGVNSASSGVNNTSSGVNNASSGVNNASSGVNNASSGVNNASAGVNNASPGVNNASPGVNNASPGVNNASDIWQRSRLAVARGVCGSAGRIAGRVEKVYVLETRRVAYCSTHKVASTFWMRVYRWMYNDTRTGHVASPLNISKLDAHLLPLKRLKVRNLTKHVAEDQAMTDASYRFLFTRDPYARLWSVYIDKFLLPDNYFWSFYTPRIKAAVQTDSASQPRQQGPQSAGAQDHQAKPWWSQLNLAQGQGLNSGQGFNSDVMNSATGRGVKSDVMNSAAGQGENSAAGQGLNSDAINSAAVQGVNSAAGRGLRSAVPLPGGVQRQVRPAPRGAVSSLCPQVTFREFLLYIVVHAARAGGQALDDHFRPVHYGCNPCQFRPDFIGHMETMREDSAHVLRQMGLDQTLPELSASHVEQEVDMLVSFNFDLVVTKRLQRRCVSDRDLESRLLTAFVYNGYLDADSAGRLERRLPLGRAAFREAVLGLHRHSGAAAEDLKQQKERFKLEAFRQVPVDLLLAVQKVFHWDFELFGYDPFPSELFGSV